MNVARRSPYHLMKALYVALLLASSVSLALVGTAAADDAMWASTRFTTFLRTGPGVQYRPIDELAAGSDIEVESCEAGWCQVVNSGVAGFIDARMIAQQSKTDMDGPALACFEARLPGYFANQHGLYCLRRAEEPTP